VSSKRFLDCIIHRRRLLCRAAMAVVVASLSHSASAAESAGPLTFQTPAAQLLPPGFAIVSDLTIQPFVAPGIGAPFGLRLAIDLQGNGRPDIVGCHADYPPYNNPIVKVPCRVLRTQPDGSLTDITRQIFGTGTLPSVTHPRQMVFGDFNHDGRPDIFVAAHGYDAPPFDGETNLLFVSNADGTYADRSSTLPQVPDFSHSACVGDVDGDGNLDIYVGNTGFFSGSKPGPYILIGKGDGTFTQKTSGLPPLAQSQKEKFNSCLLVDVDQDGYPDLVLGTTGANAGTNDNIVLFNDGTGDFTRRPRSVLPAGPLPFLTPSRRSVYDVVTLDINRDGRPDLLLLWVEDAQSGVGFGLQVLINQGNGIFADETAERLQPSTLRTTGPGCLFLHLADFNGDGWEDFYCEATSFNEGEPELWLNNGNGTWSPVAPASLPVQSTLRGLSAVDFDGDGRIDLVRFASGGPDIGYRSYLNRTPRTVPSEPLIGGAISGKAQATIFFTVPLASGAFPITGYTATCSPGTFAGVITVMDTGSPITVTGLTNGRRYACSVTASNAAGTSLPSGTATARPAATVPPERQPPHRLPFR
jgi:VCBS repeat protein